MDTLPLAQRTIPQILQATAERTPEAAFLVEPDRTFSYAETIAITDALAGQLQELGIAHSTRVAIYMDNSVGMILSVIALARLGALTVLINPELQNELLTYIVDDSNPEFIVTDSGYRERLSDATANVDVQPMLLIHDEDLTDVDNGALHTQALPLDLGVLPQEVTANVSFPAVSFADPAFVIYTSGTTSRAKGVVMTHGHAVTQGTALIGPLELSSDDHFYIFIPLFHALGLCTSVLGTILAGASASIVRRFSVSRFWSEAIGFGATIFCAPSSVFELLLKTPPSTSDRDHRIRVAYAVPLPQEPHDFEDRFGIPLSTGYAMTETPPVAKRRAGESYDQPTHVGQVQTDLVEVRIFGPDDIPLEAGQVGEIVVRPVLPATGAATYLNKAEATLEAHRNLWFHTGDVGYLDQQNNLYFQGRQKEAIRRRGEFVSPLEVESVLLRSELVREVAAFAVPSELGEDDIAIAVAPAEGAGEPLHALIHDFARRELPRYMQPRYVAIVDRLPMTQTGKVSRLQLAKEFDEDRLAAHDFESPPGASDAP